MVRGRSLAVAILVAVMTGSPGRAEASVLELVKRMCLDEPLPYGRETRTTERGDRTADLEPGDPEYDQSLPLLPPAPAGWTAEPPQIRVFSSHTIGCAFRIARSYRLNDKDLGFSLLFAAGVKDLREELSKPSPEVSPPERLLTFKGRKGYDRIETPDRDLMLVVGSMMLVVDGSASEANKRALLDAANLDAIEAFRF